jgi:hypothetical protein
MRMRTITKNGPQMKLLIKLVRLEVRTRTVGANQRQVDRMTRTQKLMMKAICSDSRMKSVSELASALFESKQESYWLRYTQTMGFTGTVLWRT